MSERPPMNRRVCYQYIPNCHGRLHSLFLLFGTSFFCHLAMYVFVAANSVPWVSPTPYSYSEYVYTQPQPHASMFTQLPLVGLFLASGKETLDNNVEYPRPKRKQWRSDAIHGGRSRRVAIDLAMPLLIISMPSGLFWSYWRQNLACYVYSAKMNSSCFQSNLEVEMQLSDARGMNRTLSPNCNGTFLGLNKFCVQVWVQLCT